MSAQTVPLSPGGSDGIAPNANRLLWAGFMAILAAGVGAAIRGGILVNWKEEFGFSDGDLGRITGAGFTGFCFGIIIGGVIADKIGYGKLVFAAFALHVLSAVITFFPVKGMDSEVARPYLFWGTFIFAIANGTLEAVANPLVATLFPRNRTHYLNILHASWPAGLILGGLCGWYLGAEPLNWHWKWQLGLFLVPTLLYGVMFLGQAMPVSEASKSGLSLGDMFKDVGILGGLVACGLLALFFSGIFGTLLTPKKPEAALVDLGKVEPAKLAEATAAAESAEAEHAKAKEAAEKTGLYIGLGIGGALLLGVALLTNFALGSFLLFVLFVTHALVGAVELGTDGWIQNITGNILTTPQGKILFVFTSAVMFGLRFCSDFIEKRLGLSPIGILLTCAVLASVGLLMTSEVNTFAFALLALTVYGIGKTFFWPTMLAVASDQFPRTGAIAISIMGGIGMMSAGLIGSAGLGYAKDRFTGEALKASDSSVYADFVGKKKSDFLTFEAIPALEGTKVGSVQKQLEDARKEFEKAGKDPNEAIKTLSDAEQKVIAAGIAGDRMTLKADAVIPATMAVIYLCLLIYFAATGGYKHKTLADVKA